MPSPRSGIYIVSLHREDDNGNGLPNAPVDIAAIESWLAHCPGLTLQGKRVMASELGAHLATWWLPATSILYIGKAEDQSLNSRVGQYYATPLGRRSPHGGGYWLKTLSVLPDVWVHYAATPPEQTPSDWEDDLLNGFLDNDGDVPATHPEPQLALPWANLQVDRPSPRRRRKHGLPSLRNQQFSH